MQDGFDFIRFFMSSFGKRTYFETSCCLDRHFVFKTPMIETRGRDQFMKLQEKIDSNFILIVTRLELSGKPHVFSLDFTYQIHLHSRKMIEIFAHSEITVELGFITKMTVEFDDNERAEAIFTQMMYH